MPIDLGAYVCTRWLAALFAGLAIVPAIMIATVMPSHGAAEGARQGTVHVTQFGNVKIHSYVSPVDGWLVNSQIVEGPTGLIIFDAQLLLPYAEEVADYAAHLGKPVSRIVVSHAHPDHWSGLQILTRRFPSARVFALQGIAEAVKTRGESVLTGMRRSFGERVASEVTVPTEVLAEGDQAIDGVAYKFRKYADAESDLQLVALLPDQKVMLAFDLVFSPRDHIFIVASNFDHWIGILQDLKQDLKENGDYETILIGHDGPVDRTAFEATRVYLLNAKDAYATHADAKGYVDALKTAFPDRERSEWLEFSSRLLYAPPRH
jgi:glyoxylase-like metal-dependent hydrolase (beta-lactamase superfamily II)